MKANELRIGNFYQYAGYDGIIYTQVKEIKHNQFGLLGDFDGTNFEICKPIPLTEEWLLKFGFKYSLKFNDFMFKDQNDVFEIKPYKNGFLNSVIWHYNEILQEIKYVHQLQNLYFALTGEELTINQ